MTFLSISSAPSASDPGSYRHMLECLDYLHAKFITIPSKLDERVMAAPVALRPRAGGSCPPDHTPTAMFPVATPKPPLPSVQDTYFDSKPHEPPLTFRGSSYLKTSGIQTRGLVLKTDQEPLSSGASSTFPRRQLPLLLRKLHTILKLRSRSTTVTPASPSDEVQC